MFDSEFIPGVNRIEAGDGIIVSYRVNSDGEGVWTTELDSGFVSNVSVEKVDSEFVYNYVSSYVNGALSEFSIPDNQIDSDYIHNYVNNYLAQTNIHIDSEYLNSYVTNYIESIKTQLDSEYLSSYVDQQISNIEVDDQIDSEWVMNYVSFAATEISIDSDVLNLYINAKIAEQQAEIDKLTDDLNQIKSILGIVDPVDVEVPPVGTTPSDEILNGYITYSQTGETLDQNLVLNIVLESITGDKVIDTDLFISKGTKKDSIIKLVLYKLKNSPNALNYFEYLHYNVGRKSLDFRLLSKFVGFIIKINIVERSNSALFTITEV